MAEQAEIQSSALLGTASQPARKTTAGVEKTVRKADRIHARPAVMSTRDRGRGGLSVTTDRKLAETNGIA